VTLMLEFTLAPSLRTLMAIALLPAYRRTVVALLRFRK